MRRETLERQVGPWVEGERFWDREHIGELTAEATARLRLDFAGEEGGDLRAETREILEILVHDGYLRPTDRGYEFVSRLLRDWWQARFRFEFIPAGRR